jgi:hypothetical protein
MIQSSLGVFTSGCIHHGTCRYKCKPWHLLHTYEGATNMINLARPLNQLENHDNQTMNMIAMLLSSNSDLPMLGFSLHCIPEMQFWLPSLALQHCKSDPALVVYLLLLLLFLTEHYAYHCIWVPLRPITASVTLSVILTSARVVYTWMGNSFSRNFRWESQIKTDHACNSVELATSDVLLPCSITYIK